MSRRSLQSRGAEAQRRTAAAPRQLASKAGAAQQLMALAGHQAVSILLGSGEPLAPALRAEMEGRFGVPFDDVRLHDDSAAHSSAAALQAEAYTVGPHIVLHADARAPREPEGRHLLAHELAHVVQQRRGGSMQPRSDGQGPLEADARQAADAAAGGGTAAVRQGSASGIAASPWSDRLDRWKDAAANPGRTLGEWKDKAVDMSDRAGDALQRAAHDFDRQAANKLSDMVTPAPEMVADGLDALADKAKDSPTLAGPTARLRNTVKPLAIGLRDANRDLWRETLVGKGFQAGADQGIQRVDDAMQGLFQRYEQDDFSSEKAPEAKSTNTPLADAWKNYGDDPSRIRREGDVGTAQALWKIVPGTGRMLVHPVATLRSLADMPAAADPMGVLRGTGVVAGFEWDALSGQKTLLEASEAASQKARPDPSKEWDKGVNLVKGLTHDWGKAYGEGRPVAAVTQAATDIAMFVLPFLDVGKVGAASDALNVASKGSEVSNATKVVATADAVADAKKLAATTDAVVDSGKLADTAEAARGTGVAGGAGKGGFLDDLKVDLDSWLGDVKPANENVPSITQAPEGRVLDMPLERPRDPSPYSFKADSPKVQPIGDAKTIADEAAQAQEALLVEQAAEAEQLALQNQQPIKMAVNGEPMGPTMSAGPSKPSPRASKQPASLPAPKRTVPSQRSPGRPSAGGAQPTPRLEDGFQWKPPPELTPELRRGVLGDTVSSREVDAAVDAARPEGSFVQGGETYANDRAMKALRGDPPAPTPPVEPAAELPTAELTAKPATEPLSQRPAATPPVEPAAELPTAEPTAKSSTEPLPQRPVGVTAAEVEGAVQDAKQSLKEQKVSGLDDRVYGTRLHTELRRNAETVLGRKLDSSTEFFNDRSLAEIKGMSPAEAQMRAGEWLAERGLPDPGLSPEVRNQPIGKMKPDLAFREPGGVAQVIDLTGQPVPQHLAKTVLYTLVLGVP